MPNWCNNTVEIGHSDPAKIKELVTAVNEGKFLNYCRPVPEALQIVAGRVGADDNPEQIALQEQTMNNLSVYGYANWYDFCVGKWGTKWDVEAYDTVEYDGKNGVTFGFDSAWAPPVGIYDALVEQGFTVRAYYYEPGMAFAGVWEDGYDDEYSLGGMTSTQAREDLPKELDEMFGISDGIAEYEAEEAEEE